MEVVIRGKSGNIYTLPLENRERFLKSLELNCLDYFYETAGNCYPYDFHYEIIETREINTENAKKIIRDYLSLIDSRFII